MLIILWLVAKKEMFTRQVGMVTKVELMMGMKVSFIVLLTWLLQSTNCVKALHYVFAGHIGPITGVDKHKASGIIDLSHLFLSCSLDWTIKLWSTKVRWWQQSSFRRLSLILHSKIRFLPQNYFNMLFASKQSFYFVEYQ